MTRRPETPQAEPGAMVRIRCCIPFCRGKAIAKPDDEALCRRHWDQSAGPIRRRYEAAWAEATKADRLGVEDLDAFARVTAAWNDLKAHAIMAGRA